MTDALPIDALPDGHRPTDDGNAERFVDVANGKVRYVPVWGTWMVYSKGRWVRDTNAVLATEAARCVAASLFELAERTDDDDTRTAILRHARYSSQARAVSAMLTLSRGAPGMSASPDDFDAHPELLNCLNGTVDLRTGELLPHDPADLLLMQAPTEYDPDADAPTWARCLEEWQPDPETRRYLQQVAGSGATGYAPQQLFVHHGGGANGKSTYFDAKGHALGPYVVPASRSLVVHKRNDEHPTVLASLYRARTTIVPETSEGDRLNEEMVKTLTGGDLVRARRMREDEWSFLPTHTVSMHTNHRPVVRDMGESMWRRIRPIGWDVTIPPERRDPDLPDRLKEEATGVLAWVVQGAVEWLKNQQRFAEPSWMARAVEEYRDEEDHLGRFIEERCEVGDGLEATNDEIWGAYKWWCETTGDWPRSSRSVGKGLTGRGFGTFKRNGKRGRTGLRVRPEFCGGWAA